MKMNLHRSKQKKISKSISLLDSKAWVFEQMNQVNISEKIFGTFEFTGELNVVALEKSLKEIYSRSECCEHEEILTDTNHEGKCFSFEFIDLRNEKILSDSIHKIVTNESDYDFSTAFLFKAKLLKVENRKFLLAINVHQKINEGLTPLILLKEIVYLYSLNTKDDENQESIVAFQYDSSDYSA